MEKRELTCIVCPVGCRVTVEIEGEEMRVSGNRCKRGEAYCRQEVSCPVRTVTSLVAVSGSEHPLCPVKTSRAIPRAKIAESLLATYWLPISLAPARILWLRTAARHGWKQPRSKRCRKGMPTSNTGKTIYNGLFRNKRRRVFDACGACCHPPFTL